MIKGIRLIATGVLVGMSVSVTAYGEVVTLDSCRSMAMRNNKTIAIA